MVNKARLIEKIAELVHEKRVDGISDLRDESDREGMRIVIELKRDVNANVVLNYLYKHTQLQDTFGVIMLALVDGEPRRLLNLHADASTTTSTTRSDVVDPAHAVRPRQGRGARPHPRRACSSPWTTSTRSIRSSARLRARSTDAKEGLMEPLRPLRAAGPGHSRHAPCQRLTGLEREKTASRSTPNCKSRSPSTSRCSGRRGHRCWASSGRRLLEVKRANTPTSAARRSARSTTRSTWTDLIQEEDMVVTLTHYGYVKRLPADTYRAQKRGGKGVIGATTREEDFVEQMFVTSTHDPTSVLHRRAAGPTRAQLLRDSRGRAHGAGARPSSTCSSSTAARRCTAVHPRAARGRRATTWSWPRSKGLIKKTAPVGVSPTCAPRGLIAIDAARGRRADRRGAHRRQPRCAARHARRAWPSASHEDDVRAMGRAAMGVRSMRPGRGRRGRGHERRRRTAAQVLTITENGYGKRTEIDGIPPADAAAARASRPCTSRTRPAPWPASCWSDEEEDIMHHHRRRHHHPHGR